MKMHVQVDSSTESMDRRDGTALRMDKVQHGGLFFIPTKDLFNEESHDSGKYVCLRSQQQAKFEGNGQDPLTYWNIGRHPIHKLSCCSAHTPHTTTGTQTAAFARKRNEQVL